MKKSVTISLAISMVVLFVVAVLDYLNVISIQGSFLTPLLALATAGSINANPTKYSKKSVFYIAQIVIVLFAIVGVIFMFIPVSREADASLIVISAFLLISTSVAQMFKSKKKNT